MTTTTVASIATLNLKMYIIMTVTHTMAATMINNTITITKMYTEMEVTINLLLGQVLLFYSPIYLL